MRLNRFAAALAVIGLAVSSARVYATPYASNVNVSGTSVTFTLNEPTDSLSYVINGGAPVNSTDGLAKGTHTFTIPAGATFSINADKNAATGFLIPTGGTITAVASTGVRIDEPASGTNLITDDSS